MDKDREEFLAWKEKWGKEYPSKEEDESRFKTFQQHLHEIQAHNSGLDSAYWTKGLNRFSYLTDKQFKIEFLGCKHPSMYKDVGYDEVMCWGSSSDDDEEEDTNTKEEDVKRQRTGCCDGNDTKEEVAVPMEPEPEKAES